MSGIERGTVPRIMNRAERRRQGLSGSRLKRTGTLASAGVLLSAGLLGAYLGNPRLQRAYAATVCPSGPDASVTNETQLGTALSTPDVDCILIDGTVTLTSDLTIVTDSEWGSDRQTRGLTIYGDPVDGADVIDGDGNHAGFSIDLGPVSGDVDVTVSGLTMTDLTSSTAPHEGGAALRVSTPEPSIGDVSITLSDSTFTGNASAVVSPNGHNGGAVYIYSKNNPVAVTVENSTFSGNDSGPYTYGGGLFVLSLYGDVDATLSSSAFVNNHAGTAGGGMVVNAFLAQATVTATNSFFGGNSASSYAGLFVYGDINLEFSTVYDNTVTTNNASQVLATGRITAIGSVIGSSTSAYVFAATAFDDTSSVSTNGPSSPQFVGTGSGNVTPGTLAMGPLDGTAPGAVGRSPLASSPLAQASTAGGFAPSTNPLLAVTRDQLGALRTAPFTIGARQVTSAPPPARPPSAPREVTGAPGEGSGTVSWQAPLDPGSFPVTHYQAVASPGGKSCLAIAPALTCTVTGLANGSAYTFTVQALNGAGWGPAGGPSSPVTPSMRSLTLNQGTRTTEGNKDRITTGGSSRGVPQGAKLTPWIRYGDSGAFKQGQATITIGADGRFTWTRLILPYKKLTAYVSYQDLESNRAVWQRIS